MTLTAKIKKRTQRKRPQVPGQYLGFSLQATRFLVRLLEADPDWFVSLEVFDDVGLEGPKGQRLAEQSKSALAGNPVSDRGIDLWKTFSNWVDAVEAGELPIEKTLFEIYVAQPRSGPIVKSFSEAKTLDEARQALRRAKTLLWGRPPEYPIKAGLAKTVRSYVTRVFDADELLVSKIIRSFTYSSGL